MSADRIFAILCTDRHCYAFLQNILSLIPVERRGLDSTIVSCATKLVSFVTQMCDDGNDYRYREWRQSEDYLSPNLLYDALYRGGAFKVMKEYGLI